MIPEAGNGGVHALFLYFSLALHSILTITASTTTTTHHSMRPSSFLPLQ